jgi:excisionase family DNA binding protein
MERKQPRRPRGAKRRAIFIDPSEAQRPLIAADGTVYVPPTVTPDQLAAMLQCSRQHITQKCVSGKIKAQRLGTLWIIGRSEVLRLLGAE